MDIEEKRSIDVPTGEFTKVNFVPAAAKIAFKSL